MAASQTFVHTVMFKSLHTLKGTDKQLIWKIKILYLENRADNAKYFLYKDDVTSLMIHSCLTSF